MKRINLFAFAAIFLLATGSTRAQQTQTPGGVNNTGYTWLAWLTPDSYNNGIWTNLIQSTGGAGNFTAQGATAPPKINSGYNFHPSLNFPAGNTYWLKSANSLTIAATDNITAIFVLKRSTVLDSYNYLLAFSDVSGDGTGMGIGWRSHAWGGAATQDISWKWRNTDDTYHFTGKPVTEGIVVIDNAKDASAGGLTLYLNGENPTSTITATPPEAISNQPIGIGSEVNAGGAQWYYRGTLQEIILLKANGSTHRIEPDDLKKIHSSLAIKYGTTLNNGLDYVNSAGQSVWDRTANAAYGYHITGIARDDASGLYQKQSKSINAASLLTVFVGSNVAALNSGNGGQLPNGVYAIFGSNNGNINTVTDLSPAIPVTPGSSLTVNYRKGLMYKAQLTGATAQKVKLKFDADRMGGALPKYMIVSSTSNFLPDNTKVFPLTGSTAEVELTAGSNYIAFGGHSIRNTEGPGGVGGVNLKLWLRADDASSIVTTMQAVGTGTLANYPDMTTGSVPAIDSWKDPLHNQTYTWSSGGYYPLKTVYQPSNLMTNYHPAVRFYGYIASGLNYSSYLGNTSTTIFDGKQYPTDGEHSAFFLVNNDFTGNRWCYTMMFGEAVGSANYDGPGYGVHRLESQDVPNSEDHLIGNVVGRFRTRGTAAYGTKDLFKPGATSILGFRHWWPTLKDGKPDGDSKVQFRFNGLEDEQDKISNTGFALNKASMIGKGYTNDRTIRGVMSEVILYDGVLAAADRQRIESYLALKYGVTLTPGTAAGRFDYILSNGDMLWNGTAGGKWATYYNRVAAVIRDDDADLHNRQSHSTNVGSILHMGVAGSRLGDNSADLGDFDNDREAVIWGDNNLADTVRADIDPDGCGDFSHIFTRRWLIHKKTGGNRPVHMLVGAQNNSNNQLGSGAEAAEKALYACLMENYSVYMIVADSAEKLDPDNHEKYGQFTAVVPMQFLDGEQQCSYTFADSITYITFGFRQKTVGCTEVVEFEGIKTFSWTQWIRQTYGSSINGTGFTRNAPVDLGDGVTVTSTNITYGAGVTAPANYPSVTSSPVAGSLYLQRRNGAFGDTKVTVTVNLNTPVRPEFSIYDIDGYASRFEQITVSGSCDGSEVSPTLSYAANPTTSFYTIAGNVATAHRPDDLSPTDKNGQLNVSFSEGIKQIIIEFAITNQVQITTTHNLIISPIRFRQVPPPPPINEDGLSFTKEVSKRDISTCEPVEYSFYIGNVNCESKPVIFRDTLPAGMKWTGDISWSPLTPMDVSDVSYSMGGRALEVIDLDVPGAGVLRLTATAVIDDGEVPVGTTRQFNNDAWIRYVQIVNNSPKDRLLESVDRETPTLQETWFNAIGGHRQDTVRSSVYTSVSKYSADGTVNVSLTVTDPPGNDAIPSSYLDVSFDAGFEYVAGSFSSSVPEAAVASSGSGSLSIAGNSGGTEGFEIPTGASTYTFRLKAPALAGLVKEVDGGGIPTGEISPLKIEYVFTSETADPCVISGMVDVSGMCELPYQELIANDDYVPTVIGTTVTVLVPVLENDSIPATCKPLPTDKKVITKQPSNGSANFQNDSIRYTPVSSSFERDTITYRLVCGTDTAWANVYVYVAEKPDNISDAKCYRSVDSMEWSINQNPTILGKDSVSVYQIPCVGDLDGDGHVEIVVAKAWSLTTDSKDGAPWSYYSDGIFVFDRKDSTSRLITTPKFSTNGRGQTGLARPNANSQGLIVLAAMDGYLYAYKKDGTPAWTAANNRSNNFYTTYAVPDNGTGSGYKAASIMFSDFNGDGNAEIVTGDRIFDLATGKMLLDCGFLNGKGINSPKVSVADVNRDGLPELIWGGNVYSIHIETLDGTTNNTCTLIPSSSVTDPTALAGLPNSSVSLTAPIDIDRDGNVDILAYDSTYFYIYDPSSGAIKVRQAIAAANRGGGTPFIGDIDGDGYPEIMYGEGPPPDYNIVAWDIDGANTATLKWRKGTSDASRETGLTLFDFNQDGVFEILYRDQRALEIFNGTSETTMATPLASIPCYSATGSEYPVIADVDNDGQAEIIVTGSPNSSVLNRGDVFIINPGTDARWAPARKVWNQYAYNAVNINEDLTVPRYAVSVAIKFPGEGGIPVQPFNAFLQQQTTLNRDGMPIFLTADAVLLARTYDYYSDGDSLLITVEMHNGGDAVMAPVYLSAYRDTALAANRMALDSIPALAIGATEQKTLAVYNYSSFRPLEYIVVSLNDRGDGRFALAECDTANSRQSDPASDIRGVFNDVLTLQAYRQVEIDVMANDVLPAGFPSGAFSLPDSVLKPANLHGPRNGTLSVTGSGRSSKLVYTNTGTDHLTNNIDSFSYRLSFIDAGGNTQTKSATVYIYILHDKNGASACHGESYTTAFDALPAGMSFAWYTATDTANITSSASGTWKESRTFSSLTRDTVLLVKPVVPGATLPWNLAGGFPMGRFTVYAATENDADVSMRWTGLADSYWHNPDNWVEVRKRGGTSTYETPAFRSPSRCTDVVISSGAPHYPELTSDPSDSAYCAGIKMEDRAMLANPHALSYDNASVELLLRPGERDRFVSWSAPLQNMYSGDYYFKNSAGQLVRGDIYMNYFQLKNPDVSGSQGWKNMFTATFGNLGDTLSLGKAFNLWVTSTSESRNQPLIFPRADEKYTYPDGTTVPSSGTLFRGNKARFITDGMLPDGSGGYRLPINGDPENGDMLQIVNPYLAWLDVSEFLDGNNGLEGGYLYWDGKVSNSFHAVKVIKGDNDYQEGMRYYVDTHPTPAPPSNSVPGRIPPLQSFFVVGNTGVNAVPVRILPKWTTTAPESGGYQLRAGELEYGVLRIRATQGNSESYAALHFDKYVAVPEYRSGEDVRMLFYDANPLSVYVLTPLREPLAISADGEYESHVTPLGLRIAESGEVTLTFSGQERGQERFGHDVFLVDREKNVEINLQDQPSYTFTAVRPSVLTSALELNDRFVLRMVYTGVGNSPAPTVAPTWTAFPQNGEIHVRALSGVIRSLQVYSVAGALVYATQTAGDYFRIPAERGQVYFIRADVNGSVETKKTAVSD